MSKESILICKISLETDSKYTLYFRILYIFLQFLLKLLYKRCDVGEISLRLRYLSVLPGACKQLWPGLMRRAITVCGESDYITLPDYQFVAITGRK